MRARHLLLVTFVTIAPLLVTLAAPAARAGEGGGWWPDYSATNTDFETRNYITHAISDLGGNCCKWADGFRLGKVYKFDRGKGNERESTRKVALLSWSAKPDGYHARVWDYWVTGDYIELIADYSAFAPGNPTGTPIVWIWENPETKQVEIRCYGGEPQG